MYGIQYSESYYDSSFWKKWATGDDLVGSPPARVGNHPGADRDTMLLGSVPTTEA